MTEHRRAAAAAALPEDVDALLVTDLTNVRYLCGFTGSSGALLVRRGAPPLFATDGRYVEQAAGEVPDVEVLESRAPAISLAQRSTADGAVTLAVEADHLTLAAAERLRTADGAPELVPTSGLVERLRVVKDDSELELLRTATAITDAAYLRLLDGLRTGMTEQDAAWLLRTAMHHGGAQDVAFDTIVGFGEHSAVPHHQPTDRPLGRGDLVKVDFGARYAGYHADMTRTVVCGPAAHWQRELHALVARVQQQCVAATVVGAWPRELDDLARTEIETAGHHALHGLGHGVGLQVHESPFLTPSSPADRLVPGVPVTVEPGVYLPGRGGVRIEDTVVVREGHPESLTTSPRHLIEID